ncbi:MAG: efflux RND transporter periplasmic adaptor subunit [Verrucomicrobia bacterium]|nr:efflux RND transporter periplasmic adaptor subunit [Verrucomicrobiota bacterium]
MPNSFLKSHWRTQRLLSQVALVATLSLSAGSFIGCKPAPVAAASPKKPQAPVDVKLVQPKRGEVARNIALPASVIANQQVTLYSKATGYLKTISVDKGDEVKKGELIGEIEAPELLADIAKYKAELEIAELDYKRISDAQKRAPDLIVAQSIDTAKSKVAMAKANMERAETLLSFCKISAPFSGVITKRYVDPGAFVPAATAGSSAQNAALVTITDFETVRVQIAVPELEVPRVKKGLPVKVTVEGLPGKTFEGTITRFSQVLDATTRTMLAEVDFKNADGALRPGMYAIARIAIEKHSDVQVLPVEAVLIEKAGASVFKVEDGKAKKVPVKTGFNDGSFIEVLDGIQANDSVILVGKMPLANGQAVNVTQ